MNLDQAIKKIENAIKAAKQREEFGFMTDENNIKELLLAIKRELNSPKKTERKV